MADSPWRGRTLTPGQFAQRLRSLGCNVFIDGDLPNLPNTQAWKAPTGQLFFVSLEECDDKQIEGIAAQLQKWAEENK